MKLKEKKILQLLILIYWNLFYTTTVIDKIIPDVYPLWVGTDFYTLFIKFFASLGIKNPLFATIALCGVSLIEISAFVCFWFSLLTFWKDKIKISEQWFNRCILLSVLLFIIFSIGDQIFGDRFNLLEHGIFFIILVASWNVFRYLSQTEERFFQISFSKDFKIGLTFGFVLILITSYSLFDFSQNTFHNKTKPVQEEEIVDNELYKFDFPFLADKITMENTIKTFEKNHPNLNIKYIYTAPDELNSKKKTHILVYIFTEKNQSYP
ncbi:MAG: hypothetical protein OHK0036_20000 [Bacteroidia bacterium]